MDDKERRGFPQLSAVAEKSALKNKDPNENRRNQYHPALCNAMEIGLFSDRDLLDFMQSIKMNTLPREIDFLVIRKKKEGVLKSEIARFFRKCNIFEFKGYGGKLDISVFYKTMSYAYEYLVADKSIDGINDMTLSFLREGKPRELIKWFEKEGFIKPESPGWITRYRKDGYPDIQVVNISHKETPAFLRVISHKAEEKDIREYAKYVAGLPDEEQEKARLVVDLSCSINGNRGGSDMAGFFETYVDPLNKVIEEKDEEIKKMDSEMKKKDSEMKKKDSEMKKKDSEMKKKDSEIKKKDTQIKKKDEMIEKMKAEIIRLGGNVAAL